MLTRHKKIYARTTVEKLGVRYQLFVGGLLANEQLVYFGMDRAHRAGGRAFREAAQNQHYGLARLMNLQRQGKED